MTEGLDLKETLRQIVEAAQKVTGATYAACVVPSERGGLEHFVYKGMTSEEAARIGALPEGKGILGKLLQQTAPIRLGRVAEDTEAVGFPPHHPPMESFLGVPIVHHDQPIGTIYLTNKRGGLPFTQADEEAAVLLANFAALAISNADHYQAVAEKLKQRTDELADTNRTLRGLSNRILWMLESERRLLAQELHDDLGQRLSAAVLGADAIREERVAAKEGARELGELLRDCIAEIRRISHGLRPSVLDELGPVAAIQAVIHQLQAGRHGHLVFNAHGNRQRLPEPVETVLFRVAQEALTNAVRHSGASEIAVDLTFRDESVRLVVADNGIGMAVARANQGLGIVGMQERAALIGGTLEVDSKPGHGVRITLDIPI